MSWIVNTLELLAAAGVGSLLTQFLSRSGERRQLRAKVREEISMVEQHRWAKPGDVEVEKLRLAEFRAARGRLYTAAMLAHVPRKLVDTYDKLLAAAHKTSRDDVEEGGSGGVKMPVEDCVELANETLSRLLWHPVLGRLTYTWHMRKLDARVRKNRELPSGENLRWKYLKP